MKKKEIIERLKWLKHRVFDIIQPDDDNDDTPSRIFDLFIIGVIVLNVIIVVLDTFDMPAGYRIVSEHIETISIIIFTIEYVLRVWTADRLYRNEGELKSRLKYIFSPMALVDLFAILPFYLPLVFKIDLRILRLLRVVRLLRLFKVSRYTTSMSLIVVVMKNKATQLISSLFVVGLLMLISSIIMYSVENPAQPEVFTNAFSGIWWAIATFTTVGYGDIVPITTAGRLISGVIALLGIGIVAVPTGIISAGFMEQMNIEERGEDEAKHYCPYCGRRID